MFGFLLPLPFIGERAARIAIVALVAYALLPIVRNTYAGISGVDATVMDVARRRGHDGWQRLRKVELPLAMPFILAGLRTATVIVRGHRHDCGGRGRGRTGRVYFPRRGLGGQPAGACRGGAGGAAGAGGGWTAGVAGMEAAHAGRGRS